MHFQLYDEPKEALRLCKILATCKVRCNWLQVSTQHGANTNSFSQDNNYCRAAAGESLGWLTLIIDIWIKKWEWKWEWGFTELTGCKDAEAVSNIKTTNISK
jgi:hypothetical protein